MARFLIELSLAYRAQATDFDWGAAATLPFLPRLRSGRVVLSAARWRLAATDLPYRHSDAEAWDTTLTDWCARRGLPRRVLMVDGDGRLPLDLGEDAHRVVLREHLATRSYAVLEEAPAEDAAGWFGGRAHEVVVPLAAHQPRSPTRPPRTTPQRIVRPHQHGQLPGTSALLFAKLYGDPRRHDVVLAEHLPALLADWGEPPPRWWFLRYREAEEHCLRLRIALPSREPTAFGEAAARVSAWTDRLRGQGLLREVAFATSYPEIGRWGEGEALVAAETVFTADSRVVLAQLARPARPRHQVLAAANFAAIAIGFTGQVEEGMRWLVDHIPRQPSAAVPRSLFADAQRLADPRGDFRALRGVLDGASIARAWAGRAQALAAYRAHFPGAGTEDVVPDAVLRSLLHTHFLRSCGIETEYKAVCLHLARAAALTYFARTGGPL